MKAIQTYRAGRYFTAFDHFTLNTGRHYLSPREDIGEEASAVIRAMVKGTFDTEHAHRMGRLAVHPEAQNDLWVVITTKRGCGLACFDVRLGPNCEGSLVICTLMWSEVGVDFGWPVVLQTASALGLDPLTLKRPAAVPLLAVQLLPTDAFPEAEGVELAWVVDFERCLTWALLEQAETKTD